MNAIAPGIFPTDLNRALLASPRGQEMLVTLTFENAGGKTRFTLRQEVFASVAERDGHKGGWNSTFDRLRDLLQTIA